MKDRSTGKRIALAFAAIAIGLAVWVVWSLFLPTAENVDKVLHTVTGLAVMIYLTYRWSGRKMALVVGAVFAVLVIRAMATGFTF